MNVVWIVYILLNSVLLLLIAKRLSNDIPKWFAGYRVSERHRKMCVSIVCLVLMLTLLPLMVYYTFLRRN